MLAGHSLKESVMLKKLLLSVLVLCLAFLGAARPSAADQVDRQTFSDPLSYLQAHGWKVVSDGVLQRERKAGEVETFVYGAHGFTWKLQDLQSQLATLRGLFQAHPDADLRKAIVNHRQEIANTQKLLELAKAAEARGEAPVIPKDTCTITYTDNADAGYFTSAQGTYGSANASFSNNCGLIGEVYAYATASVTVNGGPLTQTVTDGPRDGANVSASAYASEYGTSPCSSYAYASVSSNSLNPSSYSQSASNSSCPLPNPPTVSISGTSFVNLLGYACKTYTFTANVSGGVPGYSYQWYIDGYPDGTNSSTYSYTWCGDNLNDSYTDTVSVSVTDSASQTGSASHNVNVSTSSSGGCYAATSPSNPNKIVPICPQQP
jgi:hypothetical protein